MIPLSKEATSVICTDIKIINDQIPEGVEFFTVVLKTPSYQRIQSGSITETEIIIVDAGILRGSISQLKLWVHLLCPLLITVRRSKCLTK